MKIWKEPFGTTKKGEAVERWWLENKNGTKAAVLTYGATLQSLIFADTDIALGFIPWKDMKRRMPMLVLSSGVLPIVLEQVGSH